MHNSVSGYLNLPHGIIYTYKLYGIKKYATVYYNEFNVFLRVIEDSLIYLTTVRI